MLIFSIKKIVQRLTVNIKFNRKYTIKMEQNEDNRLETFQRVCDEIGAERSYINKSKILQNFLRKGSDKKGFQGDTLLWIQMLLPATSQRVYNLQNKQMLKLFARLFACSPQDMQLDLEQEGDVSETLRKFFETAKLKPQPESTLFLHEVEEFLVNLEKKTKEDEQMEALRQLCKKATAQDLKMIIRMIKQDLRINAGARHILDAFGPFAYPAYQSSRDLAAVVQKFSKKDSKEKVNDSPKAKMPSATKKGQIQVMTPISPMLANACKSVEEAFKKSPSGLYSEIKYDGERVQIHKRGSEFKFFSRNLKPVMDHKVKRFKEFIPKAFPGVGHMILDSEIILVDTVSGELLPFGSLGVQKKKEFQKSEVCLFVFDCILFNGEDLTNLAFRERRKILEDNITPIKSYVQLSESHFLKTKDELSLMTAKVLKANLEGVVLKSPSGSYQPGKRGWLKVKKDYLFDGKMADTADLVVLGGSFGSGKKGGILSIFLMGCYDRRDSLWKTVTKVHSGLDDATQEELHEKLMSKMVRSDPNRLPNWLLCKKSLVPDYIAKSPLEMPVWEITGAEFTKSEAHTAAGISIRFPRITRLRDDKSPDDANDLEYLQKLYDASKNSVNVDLLVKGCQEKEIEMGEDDELEIDGKCKSDVTPLKRAGDTIKEEDQTSTKKIKIDQFFDGKCNSNVTPLKRSDDATKEEDKTSTKKNKIDQFFDGKSNSNATPLKSSDDTTKEEDQISTKKNKIDQFFGGHKKGEIKAESKNQSQPKDKNPVKKEKQLKLNFGKVTINNNASNSNNTGSNSNNTASNSNNTASNSNNTGSNSNNTGSSSDNSSDKNTSITDQVKTESDIFKDVVAYFVNEAGNDKLRQLFSTHGGIITENSTDATMAFYDSTKQKINLDDCRKNFKTSCRHLSVDWVNESVAENKCAEFPMHAVMLE